MATQEGGVGSRRRLFGGRAVLFGEDRRKQSNVKLNGQSNGVNTMEVSFDYVFFFFSFDYVTQYPPPSALSLTGPYSLAYFLSGVQCGSLVTGVASSFEVGLISLREEKKPPRLPPLLSLSSPFCRQEQPV